MRACTEHHPSQLSHAFRTEDGDAIELSYGELDAKARAIAAELTRRDATGRRLLLMFPPAAVLDFVAAFYGSLYAGAVAVPLPPPAVRRRVSRRRERLDAIVERCDPFAILTTDDLAADPNRIGGIPALERLPRIATSSIDLTLAADWRMPAISGDTIAYLQFTSGSTGTPKGVIVSHGDAARQCARYHRLMQYGKDAAGVTWLPVLHDWGLVTGVLEPVHRGYPSHFLTPEAFIQEPGRWLRAISETGATHSEAPNFAYDLCVRRVPDEELDTLDLSRWRYAGVGAETIREHTLEAFAKKFARCGFRPGAFRTAYGLAETVAAGTGDQTGGGPRFAHLDRTALAANRIVPATSGADAISIACCGTPLRDGSVAIVDPATRAALDDDRIGEVWFGADEAARGYWGDDPATEETFRATLATGEGPWLRTGDAGFLRDGALYITGRIKELIIIGGRNLYPQDVEVTAQSAHAALVPGGGAAFSIDDGGEERLVVVHEVVRPKMAGQAAEIAARVRKAVAEEHGVALHALVLLPPGRLFKTTSGKIERLRCREAFLNGALPELARWGRESRDAGQWLAQRVAERCGMAASAIDRDAPFTAYGIGSHEAAEISGELARFLGRKLPASLLYEHPTIRDVVAAVSLPGESSIVPPQQIRQETPASSPIAIVGAACRFPGAPDFDAFATLLANGVDAIGRRDGIDRRGGFVEDIDHFDAPLFRMSAAEARSVDPQQRLLLEAAWEALEHAGQAPDALAGTDTGVFVGLTGSDYQRLLFAAGAGADPHAASGTSASVAAGRISYAFGLRGPSMVIDTSCSSSLVAVHAACQSLRAGECTLALAGGANALFDPALFDRLADAGMLSPTGACHPFDASADGYVRGEGCGMIVLKRLDDALRDGNPVLAVIRGSAVNQDGRTNGLTAPSGAAQQDVIRAAVRNAGVLPSDVDYVEAHGTSTALGDPIELRALDAALGEGRRAPLLVGSVKTNIGHLEAAAGIAGLLKVLVALQQERIPAHLHFHTPSAHVWWNEMRVAIAATPVAWPRGIRRRVAGVSSFGFSGTNAHVIVEDAPERPPRAERAGPHRLVLSAATPSALAALAARYHAFLGRAGAPPLADVCHTAAIGRAALRFRAAFTAHTTGEMHEQLARFRDSDARTDLPVERPSSAEGRRIAIPTYPFERRRYWFDAVPKDDAPAAAIAGPEDVTFRIRELVAALLGCSVPEVHDDVSLASIGIDSLMAMRLRSAVETMSRVSLPLSSFLGGPTPAGLAATIIEAIAAEPRADRVVPAESCVRAPLSFAQMRLWLLEQLDPGNAAYNLPTAIRLRGAVDAGVLERTLAEIVRRHEVLRSRFTGGDEPAQIVTDAALPPLAVIDASDEAVLDALIREDAARPFALAEPPLLRASLYRISATDHVLGLTFHHIVADGWSLAGILLGELRAIYGAFAAGAPSPLAEPRQYAAFAAAQRTALAGDALEPDLDYWTSVLADAPPPLVPPADHRPPETRTMQGVRVTRTIPRATLDAIKALSRERGTTLFVTLAAALAASLYRWSGQEDLVIGTAVTNRSVETEHVFGDFTNFIPLRVRVHGADGTHELLQRVQESVLAALAHAHCPFDRIVAAARPQRDPRRNPLYDVALVVHTFAGAGAEVELGDGLTARFLPPLAQVDNGTAELALIFEAAESEEGLVVQCELAGDLFERASGERMLRQYGLLLAAMCAGPQRTVDRLPMTTDDERAALVAGTRRDYATAPSLIAAFHDAAARFADRVAVSHGEGALTYRELQAAAHRVARQLAAMGVTRGDRVGLRMVHGPDLIVAMLAVLEAGAAYVPLDPTWPEERVRWQIADAGLRIVLAALPDVVPGAAEAAFPLVGGADAAYVIYTSGSTGRPKGVVVTHENVLRLFASTRDAYRPTQYDTWTLFHSFAFDFSVWEIWGALLYGGRVAVVPYDVTRDPRAFAELLDREHVTVLSQTPTAFRGLMHHLLERGQLPPSLRLVVFGGEALDPLLLGEWLDRFGDERPELVNMYGITETTVHVTWRQMRRNDVLARRGSVIGQPLGDLEVLLLDAHGEPVSPGIAGEIHVGGAGLARGYLDRPELTAERFVPHPWRRGERLYRSGDLARRTAGGELEYLGRIDQQVKLRGYRIEPAEIEAVLRGDPRVRDCAVRAVDASLVAWVVPRETATSTRERVTEWKHLFDDVYTSPAQPDDTSLNTAGWTSSYTRQPIPAAEMRDWAEHTVRAILALEPRRVLEIGCGTGMLLLRVAPHCERYTATDLSPAAIDYLRGLPGLPSCVELLEREATDFRGIEEGAYDVVVLNSVTQLFPGAAYLLDALDGAVRRVRPGGCVFVGDVRNHRLLEAFHRSVLRHDGIDDDAQLRARIENEQELTVAPELFAALGRRIPRVRTADVRVKRTADRNEMTCFRYDVVLHVDREAPAAPSDAFVPWTCRDDLAHALAAGLPLHGVTHIPNSRVVSDVDAVDPATLVRLGDPLGYDVRVRFSPFACDGRVDALFQRRGDAPLLFPQPEAVLDLAEFANTPAAAGTRLAADLRERLQRVLPSYMVPSSVVTVDALPLGPTGKLDVARLPVAAGRALRETPVAPRNAIEERIHAIWCDVLGIGPIGVLDDFFDLGGHSLQAAQVVNRVRAALACELPLRVFFDAPTVAGLSDAVSRGMAALIRLTDYASGGARVAHQ
ncbi:MAG TPA: amino acid adenylation domain-containing protein [Thermoanaerobaculia bacterium]